MCIYIHILCLSVCLQGFWIIRISKFASNNFDFYKILKTHEKIFLNQRIFLLFYNVYKTKMFTDRETEIEDGASIYIYTLLVCLLVTDKRQNGKTDRAQL